MNPPAGSTGSPDPSVDWGAVTDAARAALAGRLIVLPTDTVYGIGTRPDDPHATARVFEAKDRDRSLTLPVLVSSFDQAASVALFDARSERVAHQVWPGAVTLILPRTPAASTWALGGEDGTVGVRVPDHPVCRAVLDRTGPLAVTSANRSGEPTPSTIGGIRAVFGDRVAAYVDAPGPTSGLASTVLDLAHGEPVVLREGAIDPGELARVLGG